MSKVFSQIKKGFSLFEIGMVLTIIAVLISCVAGGKALLDSAKMNLIHSEMNTIKLALMTFIKDNNMLENFIYNETAGGDYPINMLDLTASGYLQKNKAKNNGGSSGMMSRYESKNGGYWYLTSTYDSEVENEVPTLILTSSLEEEKPIMSEILCQKFLNKFSIDDIDDTTKMEEDFAF